MKKRNLTSLALKKEIVSSLNEQIYGGAEKYTVTCARPFSECTIALTVQPFLCNTLPRPIGNCTVQYSIQPILCETQDKNC